MSAQAIPSIPSPPSNYIILRSIGANPAPCCSQSPIASSSSEPMMSIPANTSSGNDRSPVMFPLELSSPCSEPSASGPSGADASQAMVKRRTTGRRSPRFTTPSTCPPGAETSHDATSLSNPIPTNGSQSPNTGRTSAVVPSRSVHEQFVPGLHLGTPSSHSSAQTSSHDQIAYIPSARLLSVEPVSMHPPLDASDIRPLAAGTDVTAKIRQEMEDRQLLDIHVVPALQKVKKRFTITSVRRSNRVNREDHLPLGPRHLELEYHEAWEELRYVTLKAVFDLGYDWKKIKAGRPVRRTTPPTVREIMAMKIPSVMLARRRVDEVDQRLNDALARGFTWDNTPLPKYKVVEDEKGNVLDVILVEDPLTSEPVDLSVNLNLKQTGKKVTKRKHEQDTDPEQEDQAKRRCLKA